MSQSSLLHQYEYDSFTVYNYNGKYKVVFNNVKRVKGFECDNVSAASSGSEVQSAKDPEDAHETEETNTRFIESLIRSKNKIFGYAMCNSWDYFATFTLDSKKRDRFDLNQFYKDFSKFINNFNRKLDNNIKYLLIPEQHKNGAWHMHGLIANLPKEYIKQFQLSDKLPLYLKSKIKKGEFIGSWVDYSKKFGFNDLELIKDSEKVSSYMVKYITKDFLNTEIYNSRHLYYCSKGLNSPCKINVVPLPNRVINYGYENDYCKIKWYDDIQSLAKDFSIC